MAQDPLQSQVLEGQLSGKLAKYDNVLEKISTFSQVSKLQEVLSKEQVKCIGQLDSYIANTHATTNQNIRKLELNRAKLTKTLSQFHQALENISNSSNLARDISGKIGSVERERKLVAKTLKFVTDVNNLKLSISVVNEALSEGNLPLAAKSIDEIRKLPHGVIVSEFAKRVVPSSDIPEEPEQLLNQWISQLSDIFHKNFLEAAQKEDVGQLTSVFQMFPLIGQSELGLDLYSKYVCDIIAEQSRKIMTNITSKNSGFYAQVLLHLFKIVSTIINEHSKIISKYYGKEHMIHIMKKVQKEADMQAGLVLDTFIDSQKIDRTISDIKEWDTLSKQKTDDQALEEPIHLNELSSLINDFSAILQNWTMYCRFFAVKWNEYTNDGDLTSLVLPEPIEKGKFYSKILEEGFLSNFEVLDRHYLYQSFSKVLALEELPSLNDYISYTSIKHDDISTYPLSSVVEDVTMLIRTSLIVNVNTGETSVLSHFLDVLVKFIQNEYLVKFLQSRLRQIQTRFNSSLGLQKYVPPSESVHPSRAASPSAAEAGRLSHLGFFKGAASSAFSNIQSNLQAVYADEESVLKLHHYLIYINSLSIGCKFFHKLLVKELIEDNPRLLHDSFPFQNDSQMLVEKVRTTEEIILTQNHKLLQWSIRVMFDSLLQGKFKKMSSPLFVNGTDNEYIATSADFENMQAVDEFRVQWRQMMIPFQNVLHKDSYLELLTLIVDYLVKNIEPKILHLQVNELGSIKLERELSVLITTVCSENYFLRDKFARLTQIILILGFEDDDFDTVSGDVKQEIVDNIGWILNPQERIQVANLRVDKRH